MSHSAVNCCAICPSIYFLRCVSLCSLCGSVIHLKDGWDYLLAFVLEHADGTLLLCALRAEWVSYISWRMTFFVFRFSLRGGVCGWVIGWGDLSLRGLNTLMRFQSEAYWWNAWVFCCTAWYKGLTCFGGRGGVGVYIFVLIDAQTLCSTEVVKGAENANILLFLWSLLWGVRFVLIGLLSVFYWVDCLSFCSCCAKLRVVGASTEFYAVVLGNDDCSCYL